MCLDHIKHSQKCCNEFIKDDETLSGTIHHLQEIRVEPNEQQVLAAEQQLAEEPVQCHDGTDLYFAGQEPFDEEELEADDLNDSQSDGNEMDLDI